MKVLVIEDSLVSRKTIMKFMSDVIPDIEFVTAVNGEEGLDLYRNNPVDLIFLDLLMPKMDGQEVIKTIRKQDQETKIIVLTANIQSMVKKEIEELGVLTFINKPFTRDKAKNIALLLNK